VLAGKLAAVRKKRTNSSVFLVFAEFEKNERIRQISDPVFSTGIATAEVVVRPFSSDLSVLEKYKFYEFFSLHQKVKNFSSNFFFFLLVVVMAANNLRVSRGDLKIMV